jgi:hypothetical protein
MYLLEPSLFTCESEMRTDFAKEGGRTYGSSSPTLRLP